MFYVQLGSTEINGPFQNIEELHRHAFDADCSEIMVCDTMEEAKEHIEENSVV